MPNYGEASYWDERYENDKDDPFDWLFEFDELKEILDILVPDKSLHTLVVGSGNAPFSPDLELKGGFTDLINIDISKVVIDQQRESYPNQTWMVMDVTQMTFPDQTFPLIIDKSLIDTLLCCSNSHKKVMAMLKEIERVLKVGGRFITWSLHSIEEIIPKFESFGSTWKIRAYRVKSNRWNENEHRKRAVAHTMIVCDKVEESTENEGAVGVVAGVTTASNNAGNSDDNHGGNTTNQVDPLYRVPVVLTESDYLQLKSYADMLLIVNQLIGASDRSTLDFPISNLLDIRKSADLHDPRPDCNVNLQAAMENSSVDHLRYLLHRAVRMVEYPRSRYQEVDKLTMYHTENLAAFFQEEAEEAVCDLLALHKKGNRNKGESSREEQ
eukprot:gene4754-5211_t